MKITVGDFSIDINAVIEMGFITERKYQSLGDFFGKEAKSFAVIRTRQGEKKEIVCTKKQFDIALGQWKNKF